MEIKRINRILSVVLLTLTAILLTIEGTWGFPIHSSWPFIALLGSLLISLLYYLFSLPSKPSQSSVKRWGNILSHAGLFIVILGAIASQPWLESGQAVVYTSAPTRVAYTSDHQPMALPFEIALDSFYIDYYDDGVSVKQYTSILTVTGLTSKDTTTRTLTTAVNHPAHYQGYLLYQASYDPVHSAYSVIKIVRDPLYLMVLVGIILLALGAILYAASKWQPGKFILVATGLALIFAFISVTRIRFGTLMPALRSLWFIPHLIIYMLAYALLAITMVLYIVQKWWPTQGENLRKGLLVAASSLLLLGMLCGAVWAKQAWGNYWEWDPKECWAAATWMLTLAAIHIKTTITTTTTILKTIWIILAFAAMQMTWYGVNYLPSANTSLHTYNQPV